MESRAVVGALEAVEASVAALAGVLRRDSDGPDGADPLRDLADVCLDGLAEASRVEAEMAALKVHLAAEYADAATAMAAPAVSPQERTAQEMAITAEVACVLTVSERTASALLSEAHTLTRTLPLTLSALQAGTISWQHARIMVDETANLDRAELQLWRRISWTRTRPPRHAAAPPGNLSRPGSGRKPAPGGNGTTRSASKHAMPAVSRTGGWSTFRTVMAWPGSPPTSRPLPPRGSGTAPPAPRGPFRGRMRPGPSPNSVPMSPQPGSSPPAANEPLRAQRRVLPAVERTATAWTRPGRQLCGFCAGCRQDLHQAEGAEDGLVPLGDVPSPAAQVLITVPVFSLLGLTEEPAMLDGYGPVPPSMARALVADGASSLLRVLIDPRDGAPLEIGRTNYRISQAAAAMAATQGREVPVPRLQQPFPGQRGRPPPRLGARRDHRDQQPRTTMPQTPPAQTLHRLDTRRRQH